MCLILTSRTEWNYQNGTSQDKKNEITKTSYKPSWFSLDILYEQQLFSITMSPDTPIPNLCYKKGTHRMSIGYEQYFIDLLFFIQYSKWPPYLLYSTKPTQELLQIITNLSTCGLLRSGCSNRKCTSICKLQPIH